MISNYCYVTASWLFYDIIYWTIESSATAAYVLPYLFASNFSVWVSGYSFWVLPENVCMEITGRVSVPPYGPVTPVTGFYWYFSNVHTYSYFGSTLPEFKQYVNPFWYFHHANYFWWVGYLAWEEFSCHMWRNIHSYPYWFLIIWDF